MVSYKKKILKVCLMMHHLIWYGKLAEAHIKEGNKIHPNTRNNKTEILNQTANFYQ
jgi:hypothetical protein